MVLSDYRGIIYSFGYVGMILSILTLLSIIFNVKSWKSRFAFIVALVLVFLHRAWMFNAPYLYFFSFLGVALLVDGGVNEIIDSPVKLEIKYNEDKVDKVEPIMSKKEP